MCTASAGRNAYATGELSEAGGDADENAADVETREQCENSDTRKRDEDNARAIIHADQARSGLRNIGHRRNADPQRAAMRHQ